MSFSTPVAADTVIRATHVMQLRAELNEARQMVGATAVTFTDHPLTAGVTKLKAAHLNELRQSCR